MTGTRFAALVVTCAIAAAACGGPATAPPPSAGAATTAPAATAPATAPAAAGARWPQRVIRPESTALQLSSQVLDPAAGLLYALVPGSSGSYVLQAINLRTGRVRRGAAYRVNGLALAAGYLWAYGTPGADAPYLLDEISPRTLATTLSVTVPVVPGDTAAPAAGPAGSVWAGAGHTLLRISVRTGAVLVRAALPAGLDLSELAPSPDGAVLYAAAVRLNPGGAVVLEYTASTGRLLAQDDGGPLRFSVNSAGLAALPGGVWAWFRTGMMGQSLLLGVRSLMVVAGPPADLSPADSPATGSGPVYSWAMSSSAAYAGGALWVVTNSGVVACVNPATGRVRAQETVTSYPVLVTPDPVARQIIVTGETGIVAITPPRDCWG